MSWGVQNLVYKSQQREEYKHINIYNYKKDIDVHT